MKKYNKIDIKEKELEDLVRRFPETIEDGLRYIDHQKYTDRGPLDVLLVDSGNSLVICELKVVEDDNVLMQGLDYYDYIVNNLEGFARAYNSLGFNITPTQEPRLILVAPSFSIGLLNRCKWLDISISLFTYQCIILDIGDSNEIIPIFQEVTIPLKPRSVEVYTLEQRLNYITDAAVRQNVSNLIHKLKEWDKTKTVAEATKYDISFKVSGRVFAYLSPRRNYYLISTYDQDGLWKSYKVENLDDLEFALQIVKSNFDKFKK